MNAIKSKITLHGLKLNLHLGWSDEERVERQVVLLDLTLRFAKPPKGCETDELTDTLCYFDLINIIKTQTENIQFRLLEHLGHHIYCLIKQAISLPNSLTIAITKNPACLPDLSKGVTFEYGDED